jgi:hypothetical protein
MKHYGRYAIKSERLDYVFELAIWVIPEYDAIRFLVKESVECGLDLL